jgi:S1-C subfamily serine protease
MAVGTTLRFRFTALFFLVCLGCRAKESRVLAPSTTPAAAAIPRPPDTLADAIDDIRATVVQVRVMFSDGSQSTGTGFWVNSDGVVVTANHVVSEPGKNVSTIGIYTRIPTTSKGRVIFAQNFAATDGKVLARDERHDIALLKASLNPFPNGFRNASFGLAPVKEVKFDTRSVRDGEPIFISGFPLSFLVLITTSGNIASSERFTVQTPETVDDIYEADIHVNFGNSGGPVFDRDSRTVIGLCVAFQPSPLLVPEVLPNGRPVQVAVGVNSGIVYVVPNEYITELLKANNLAFSLTISNLK